jgi:nitroreductase
MDTFEAIRTVRSVRDFEARNVPEETIKRILDAGRLSGSSKNTQPWQFVLIQDKNILNQLARCGDYAEHLTRANFAIAIVTENTKRADYDAGRASENMFLAAWNEGVGSCIATMHRQDDAKKVLHIPDEYTIQVVISFGYPTADYKHPPRKGGRVPLESILHHNLWGNSKQ